MTLRQELPYSPSLRRIFRKTRESLSKWDNKSLKNRRLLPGIWSYLQSNWTRLELEKSEESQTRRKNSSKSRWTSMSSTNHKLTICSPPIMFQGSLRMSLLAQMLIWALDEAIINLVHYHLQKIKRTKNVLVIHKSFRNHTCTNHLQRWLHLKRRRFLNSYLHTTIKSTWK